MKYCIDYKKRSRILSKVDEITIKYNSQDLTLLELLKNNSKQRINIYIDNDNLADFIKNNEIENIKNYKKENENLKIYIKIKEIYSSLIDSLKMAGIPYFIDIYAFTWDIFWGLVNLGVSDIYITEDLGFELDKVADAAHSRNIQIRAFPNIAQSHWASTEGIKQFFIRPEDVVEYEPFIDVLEFYGEKTDADIFYSIYAEDKQWYGPLNEIIIGLNSGLDGRFIWPDFGKHRTSCQKRCNKGGNCNICYRVEELGKMLEEHDYFLEKHNTNDSILKTPEEFKQSLIDKIEKK